MKHLYNYIIENKVIGEGSDGIAYDCGSYIKKVLFKPSDDNRISYVIAMLDKWIKAKVLKVIPPLIKWDKKKLTYELPKFKVGTKKCQLINDAIYKYLMSCNPDRWNETRIKKLINAFGQEDANYCMEWLSNFYIDYQSIMNTPGVVSDDIKTLNLGEDKDGNVWCFDWYDPYCDNAMMSKPIPLDVMELYRKHKQSLKKK